MKEGYLTKSPPVDKALAVSEMDWIFCSMLAMGSRPRLSVLELCTALGGYMLSLYTHT